MSESASSSMKKVLIGVGGAAAVGAVVYYLLQDDVPATSATGKDVGRGLAPAKRGAPSEETAALKADTKCEKEKRLELEIQLDDVASGSGIATAAEESAQSEASTMPSSPGGVSSHGSMISLIDLPVEDCLAYFLTSFEIGRVSLACRSLREEMTVQMEGKEADHRVLVVPVVDLRMDTAEDELRRISLPHVRVVRVWSHLSLNALADATKAGMEMRSLERFALKTSCASPADVKEMLEPIFRCTRSLKLLNLEKNRVTCETMQALANAEFMSRVDTLNVRFNNIGDEGAIAFANSPYCKNIQVLNLKQNRVTDRGAKALANMLADNRSMRLLNIRRQTPPLTDRAAAAFADMFRTNTGLEQLRLRRNRISDIGAELLAVAAQERLVRMSRVRPPWETVRLELDLEENKVGVKGGLALLRLADACPQRVKLELLLSSNPVTRDSLCAAVVEARESLDAMDTRLAFDSKPEAAL